MSRREMLVTCGLLGLFALAMCAIPLVVVLSVKAGQWDIRQQVQQLDPLAWPAKPIPGWTFHEMHPLHGAPLVLWLPGDRNPDENVRPDEHQLPQVHKFIRELYPCPEPTDGNPLGGNAIVWRDQTVEGGYTWYQGHFKYLMDHRHEARPAPEE